jgi:hypothetical protein
MAGVYNRGKLILADGSLVWASDTVRALLVDASYVYDDDHNFVADITGELTDVSYARQTLGTKSVVENDTTNEARLLAAPVDYGALDNETPMGQVLFKLVTNDADSPLISFSDAGFGAAANGAGFVVNGEGASDNEWVIAENP